MLFDSHMLMGIFQSYLPRCAARTAASTVVPVRQACRLTFRGYAKFAASQRGIASIINPYPRYSKPFSTKNAANLGEATDRERSRVPAVTRSRAQDDCNDVHGFGIPLATGTR